MDTAELSKTLYIPGAISFYVIAMFAYAYAMANRTDRDGTAAGRVAQGVGAPFAFLGIAAHLGHLVLRAIAAGGRVPWGTMFEYSSVLALIVVVVGVGFFHLKLKRPEITTFMLLGAVLWMGVALATFSAPAPLQPILNTNWLRIHVLAIMISFALLTISFVTNGLYLVRERAESRRPGRAPQASTVGAQQVRVPVDGEVDDLTGGEGFGPSELLDLADGGADGRIAGSHDAPNIHVRRDLRDAISPFPGVIVTALLGLALGAVFTDPVAMATYAIGGGLTALAVWWAVPYLPDADTLDGLSYRVSVFAFPILTFGIISGAVWAQQSWGRYWGWDPKETSAFLTWVAYAAYLHARATRGVRGRNAAYVHFGAYAVLLFTFFAVNLIIAGLHSYGGLPA